MVALPLKRGAVTSVQDHGGNTALHLAAERGNQKMVNLLIGQGAEISPVDRLGRTPLHISAQRIYGEATKLFVDEGHWYPRSTVQDAQRVIWQNRRAWNVQ